VDSGSSCTSIWWKLRSVIHTSAKAVAAGSSGDIAAARTGRCSHYLSHRMHVAALEEAQAFVTLESS
jgi:hypothetical protein